MPEKEPYPSNWRAERIVKRLKAFVVVDPFIDAAHGLVQSFDTEEEAQQWLERKIAADDDGYAGCEVVERSVAIANYA